MAPTLMPMHTMRSKGRALLGSEPRKRGAAPRPAPGADSLSISDALDAAALFRLMTWLSPAYPVGAFSYSGGIEWAVEAGDIANSATLLAWLSAMLTEGSGWSDSVLFSAAHRALTGADDATLIETAELGAALATSRERYLETTTLGRAFLQVTRAAWPCEALDRLETLWRGPVAYPVAVASACAGHRIPLGPALQAFVTGLVSNWVSAGLRLIPLGHTDGQRVLNALSPIVAATAQRAVAAGLEDVASTTFRADIAGARHETQYTRLFRS